MKRIFIFACVCNLLWGIPDRLIIIAEGSSVAPTNRFGMLSLGAKGPLLNESLDAAGQRRAASLVALLYPKEKCAWIGAYEGDSKAMQTLLPLANAHFPNDAPTTVYQYSSQAIHQISPHNLIRLKRALTNTDGGNVILCWKRSEIALLLHDLQTFHPVFLDY